MDVRTSEHFNSFNALKTIVCSNIYSIFIQLIEFIFFFVLNVNLFDIKIIKKPLIFNDRNHAIVGRLSNIKTMNIIRLIKFAPTMNILVGYIHQHLLFYTFKESYVLPLYSTYQLVPSNFGFYQTLVYFSNSNFHNRYVSSKVHYYFP